MIELFAILCLLTLRYICNYFFDIVITIDILDTAIAVIIPAIVIIKFFYFQAKNFYLNVKKRMIWLNSLILIYTIVCIIELYHFSNIYTHNVFIHMLYYVVCVSVFFFYKKEFLVQNEIYGFRHTLLNIFQCMLFITILVIKYYSKYFINQYDIVINIISILFISIAFLEWHCSLREEFWKSNLSFKKKIKLICILEPCTPDSINKVFNTNEFLRNIENSLYYSYNRHICLNNMLKYIRKSLITSQKLTKAEIDCVCNNFKSTVDLKFMRRPSDQRLFVMPSFMKDKLYKLFNSKEKRGTYLRKTLY